MGIDAVTLTHSQRRGGSTADLGLASPNEERDGDYTIKVLPGEVNLPFTRLNFESLPKRQRKTHDSPSVERSH